MREEAFTSVLTPEHGVGREEMRTPDEVFEMRRLQSLGWGNAADCAVALPSDDGSGLAAAGALAEGGDAFEPASGGEEAGGLRLHVPTLAAPGADRLAARAGLPPAEGERGVPGPSGGGEDPPGDQPGDPGGREGATGVLRLPEGFGRVPPGGGDEGAVAAPAAGPHPPRAAGGGRDRLPAGDPERGDVVLPAHQRAVNSLWQNPHGVRPAIPPGQTAGDETHAAFGRRSIPAEPRRCAPLIVALRSEYTRYSSLTRLVSRAPRRPRRSPGFHHRLFTASLRAARRCVSVEIHPVFLPHAPCQPGASPASALTRVPPPAVNRVASRRSSLRFGRNTHPGQFSRWGYSSLTRLVSRTPTGRTGPHRSRRSRGFHHRLLRAGVHGADFKQGVRGVGDDPRRRGDGGGAAGSAAPPLPYREHSGKQLPAASARRPGAGTASGPGEKEPRPTIR